MTTSLPRSVLALIFSWLALGACSSPCNTLEGPSGISLRVTDASTRISLDTITSVTVERLTPPTESRTSSLRDTSSANALRVAAGREGTYRISLAVPGYLPWVREVRVPSASESCRSGGPRGVALEAVLVRE
ncbi:MAG: hypothetical protein Q8K82_06950 [Gemmatimonadaceae bacterium]|nr:hypothetical protein [Gemmatimonadaceae bacterium]